jgi:hypothetical protein
MRKIFYASGLFSLVSLLLVSCSQTTSTNTTSIPSSIKLSLDKTVILADGIDKALATAKDQAGNDITSTTTFVIDGNVITGNGISFEFNQQGTHKVFATKFGIISDTLTVTTAAPPAAKYSTKVLAEEFTAAWAGWCPRVTYKIDNYMVKYPKMFAIRIHNNDALANRSVDSTLRSKFGVSAVPTVVINRSVIMQENGDISSLTDTTDVYTYLQKRAVLGLALNTSISGNNLNVTAKVGFDATISDSLRLVVVAVENGLVLKQLNFYNANTFYPGNPYFSAGDTIFNFVHNGVFRRTPTSVLGTTIPVTNQVKNGEYSTNYTIDITGLNAANIRVVAFVVWGDGQAKTGILNSQWVVAGQNKAYD